MKSAPSHSNQEKKYLKLKEVKKLYVTIERHNLRAEAYKKLLQLYIKLAKNPKNVRSG